MSTYDELKERVLKFQMMQLPGQPQSMHMGTSYLVSDLWNEIQRLSKQLNEETGPNLSCQFCNNPAVYEGWYRVLDPLGIPSGLIRRIIVCDNHSSSLIRE